MAKAPTNEPANDAAKAPATPRKAPAKPAPAAEAKAEPNAAAKPAAKAKAPAKPRTPKPKAEVPPPATAKSASKPATRKAPAKPAAPKTPTVKSTDKPVAEKPVADKAPPPRRTAAARKPAATNPRATTRPAPSSRPRKAAGATTRIASAAQTVADSAPAHFIADTREKMGDRNFFATVIGGAAAIGAAVAGIFFAIKKGQGGPQDGVTATAHQADGTDSSASFSAGIADEGTIPEKMPG